MLQVVCSAAALAADGFGCQGPLPNFGKSSAELSGRASRPSSARATPRETFRFGLRDTRAAKLGSGIGSVSVAELVAGAGELLTVAATAGLRAPFTALPLHAVREAWRGEAVCWADT